MTDSDLLERYEAFRNGRLAHEDLYGLIHDLGEAGLTEAEPDLVQFLKHEDSQLRYVAVSVLALHWEMRKHRDEFERMLFEDPDVFVRQIAAAGLGHVLCETRDPQATKLLLAKLQQPSEDLSVRDAAYEALLDIWLRSSNAQRDWEAVFSRSVERTLEFAKESEKALEFPRPLNELALSVALDKKEREWKKRVNWDLVAAMERGEICE